MFLAKRTLDECMSCKRILIRKTRLLRKIEPMAMRSSVANKGHFTTRSSCDERAPKMIWRYAPKIHDTHLAMRFMIQARIDLLFTMSDISQTAPLVKELAECKVMFRGR